VLAIQSTLDIYSTTNGVSGLAPSPVLRNAVVLTMPFDLDEIEHPKIPSSVVARRAWTEVRRKAIRTKPTLTIRRISEFDEKVKYFLSLFVVLIF
jgi:hypothetical protein